MYFRCDINFLEIRIVKEGSRESTGIPTRTAAGGGRERKVEAAVPIAGGGEDMLDMIGSDSEESTGMRGGRGTCPGWILCPRPTRWEGGWGTRPLESTWTWPAGPIQARAASPLLPASPSFLPGRCQISLRCPSSTRSLGNWTSGRR